MKKKILFITTVCLLLSGSVGAQVTIGSGTRPVPGALLDLKDDGSYGATGATAKKGMVLPRVKLADVDALTMGTNEIANANNAWAAHAGLVVYNVSGVSPAKCAPIPDGLYVWDGGKWNGIGINVEQVDPATLDVGAKTYFDLASGKDARGAITAQSFTATWQSGDGTVAYTNAPSAGRTAVPFSGTNVLPASGSLTPSPRTFSLLPDAMTIANVNLPWQSKETTLKFDAADECGGLESKTVTLNQTNYGLTVNGKVVPDQENITASGAKTASIASNAQWKLSSIQPAVNSAVTSTDLNVTKGTEKKDGTAATNPLSYTVTVGAAKSRYNYLTFSDNESSKRFSDVVLTVAQCSGNSDMTMAQYKALWEEMYGLTPGVDEPNSNGNTSKNTNQVQWHRDQNNNIFFSAMFGTERWMITNLAANTYAPASPNKPALTQTYANSNTAAYYAYPNVNGTTNAALTTQYEARERLGRLYNWAAATGNQNTSTANQQNTVHGPHQGICPDSWHLPTDLEWTSLMTELAASPTKYSGNTTGASTAVTAKDLCEPNGNTGKSFGILDGGFNSLLAGRAVVGQSRDYGTSAYLWSSSANTVGGAWSQSLFTGGAAVVQVSYNPISLFSVRCKK